MGASRTRRCRQRSALLRACLVSSLVAVELTLADGAAGLEPSMLSPLAQLTLIDAQVERDDVYYFQVLTEAWQSTRVRVSIEDCTPRTAVIAAFGAEPTPSRHELLAHAMPDLAGNGTCGVDVITRPSYSRDGVWHFAVVGGSPLRGDRYFAGPPDTLAFQAAVIADSAVYPTLDRGVAASGDCLRKVAVPPVVVPTITGPPGSSASRRGGGGGQGSRGSFLPTLGRFPAGGAAEKTDGKYRGGGDGEEDDARHAAAATALLLSPSWLGAFTVSAYDEAVTVPFEIAPIVDRGGEAEGGGGAVRRGGGGTREGLVGRALGTNGTADAKLLTNDYGRRRQQQQLLQQQHRQPEDQGRRRRRQRRRGLTERAAGYGQGKGRAAGDQSGAGCGGEEQEETHQGREEERRLEHDDGGCEVTVCAAAAKIVLGIGEQDDDGNAEVPQEDSSVEGQQRVCRSVVVGGQGAAVSGTLDLPDRPQVTR
ncbi:unnamed protein product, partial [Ectocarpus sp. 12 AP-2014]